MLQNLTWMPFLSLAPCQELEILANRASKARKEKKGLCKISKIQNPTPPPIRVKSPRRPQEETIPILINKEKG